MMAERSDSVRALPTTLEDHLNRQVEHSRGFFWNRVRWELIDAQLPGSTTKVVDVGAGTGFLGDFLAEHRPEVKYAFVEPIEGLQKELEERFGADANRWEKDFFGASHLVLLDVLEHQGDDRAFLADLASRMDPGATLLLTVPAMPSLWSKWDVMLGHYRRYTKSMLTAAIDPLPFELEESAYLFPELVPVAMWRRLKRGRGEGEEGDDAEFPQLPDTLNEGLYRLGSATAAARRLAPAGTSLFARLRRT
jgi:SAM-dependent methyltransferase